jgi:hypothetical protein
MKAMLHIVLFLLFSLACVPASSAHTPYMACFDNGDGTITCNGEFSDGSSASGVPIRVVDRQNRVMIEGTMDADGEYTFRRPAGDFSVIFDAGPGHVVTEKSDTIVE